MVWEGVQPPRPRRSEATCVPSEILIHQYIDEEFITGLKTEEHA